MEEFKNKFQSYSVLIVEDDLISREKIVNNLEFYFQEVFSCENGLEAYNIYTKKKPDLIITDIEMKHENGIEFIKKLRKNNFTTPVIVISAYSKEEYLLSLINLKIDHYILKPITNKKLFEAICIALLDTSPLPEIVAELFLDKENDTLLHHDKTISIRKKERHFLELLYQNRNRIVTYDLIQDYVWGEKFMTQNALKTFIKELRRKLPFDIIENIAQEGYRLKKEEK